MSSTLSCTFSIRSRDTEAYWWPLLFEAMRRIRFGFGNPAYSPEPLGLFTTSNNAESDGNSTIRDDATFREVWTTVYSQPTDTLIEFWADDVEFFSLEGEISRRGSDLVKINFIFPGESLLDPGKADHALPSEVIGRLSRWLRGIEEIFALCGPCVAEITWERWGSTYLVGEIDALSSMETASARISGSQEWQLHTKSIVQRRLAGDAAVFLLDPFPIPWQGGWSFVSLRQA